MTSTLAKTTPTSPRLTALAAALLASVTFATSAHAAPAVKLQEFATGFTAPICVTSLDDSSGRVLIGDQIGTISVASRDGAVSEKLFLDVRDRMVTLKPTFGERGLLGLALHPRFRENRKVYVVYSAPLRAGAPAGWDHTMNLSEFRTRVGEPAQVDPATERVLMQVDKPYDNHNCGRIAFGPDGFLYYGVGDGGAAHGIDPADSNRRGHVAKGNSQDLNQPLGKILRIDINTSEGGKAYSIPRDNPFAQGGGLPEIFASGLRNPWGISFDRGGSHQLFAADVGQSAYEEVNIITKGGNYGWNRREGFICFDPKNPAQPPTECPTVDDAGQPFLNPALAYKNFGRFQKDPEARGTSITGGYMYRGKALPHLLGKYVFGDWSRNFVVPDGVLYVATPPAPSGGTAWTLAPLDVVGKKDGRIGAFVWAFGEDEQGELYVMTNPTNALLNKNGKVWKLAPGE